MYICAILEMCVCYVHMGVFTCVKRCEIDFISKRLETGGRRQEKAADCQQTAVEANDQTKLLFTVQPHYVVVGVCACAILLLLLVFLK